MIMCVLLCYPVSIHMSQLLSTGRPISSSKLSLSYGKVLLSLSLLLSTQFCGHATPYMESLYSQSGLPTDPFLRVKLGS